MKALLQTVYAAFLFGVMALALGTAIGAVLGTAAFVCVGIYNLLGG